MAGCGTVRRDLGTAVCVPIRMCRVYARYPSTLWIPFIVHHLDKVRVVRWWLLYFVSHSHTS